MLLLLLGSRGGEKSGTCAYRGANKKGLVHLANVMQLCSIAGSSEGYILLIPQFLTRERKKEKII